jgi:hypothetical protein
MVNPSNVFILRSIKEKSKRVSMIKKAVFVLLVIVAFFISCKEDDEALTPNPNFVYFQVAEKTEVHGDSYILPLLDPNDIAQARAMITDPAQAKIVLAEVTKNNSINYYVNKDLKQNKTWSWHIAAFKGFVDFTIEIYDGWPEDVEANYAAWEQNTKGPNGNVNIGFWNYTVVREVAKSELE